MKMLPVCSATPSYSSNSQISFHGCLRSFSSFRKDFEVGHFVQDGSFWGLPKGGTHFRKRHCKTQATKSYFSNFIRSTDSADMINIYSFRNESGHLKYVESSGVFSAEEGFTEITGQPIGNTNILLENIESEPISSSKITSENSLSLSDSVDIDNHSLSNMKTSIEDLVNGVSDSFINLLNKGETVVKTSLDNITSSLSIVIKRASESVTDAFGGPFSTVDQVGELAGKKFTRLSTELKEATSGAKVGAVEALRYTIVAVEDSLTKATSFVVFSFGSAKELLPPEIRNALTASEDRATKILRPLGTGFQQVYITIEGLEKNLGLDPNDPIIQFVLFLGISGTFWFFYWVWTYSGYSGDLSPQATLELLMGTKNAVLIDVRPEVLREKDSVPDLRRGARSRFASVTLPEVDGSIRKLFRSERELDDTLIAAVIRNLKIVQDSSKVIVMDADGTRSKSIARSLRKLGVKKPYLIQGGFRSWAKQGLRTKELKPETTLTILNEDAEAILEDINPSPLQVIGHGLGFVAASYALLEWEKMLQLIGIVGLGQTIYRRFSFYEDAEDIWQDVRLLLAPVRLGARAFSWAAGKMETNRIGLTTSPSSSDVQKRVLQAAAKHESQPSDTEGIQDRSPESVIPDS